MPVLSGVQDSAGKDPRIAMIKAIGFKALSVSNYHECVVPKPRHTPPCPAKMWLLWGQCKLIVVLRFGVKPICPSRIGPDVALAILRRRATTSGLGFQTERTLTKISMSVLICATRCSRRNKKCACEVASDFILWFS